MEIVPMGLDQHRAQITAEWLDTGTGEISRRRVRPADRERFRRFLAGFEGKRVEAALEATTGWRFVVEELDRADARHLRKLLTEGRLPESWIPPQHILERRSKVRLRHSLVEQRTEWQLRLQAQRRWPYAHAPPSRPRPGTENPDAAVDVAPLDR